MFKSLVSVLVGLAVVLATEGVSAADVEIGDPALNTVFEPIASIGVDGGSIYTSGTLWVALFYNGVVQESAIATVGGEGEWYCELDPPSEGWPHLEEHLIKVKRLGVEKASVRVWILEVE